MSQPKGAAPQPEVARQPHPARAALVAVVRSSRGATITSLSDSAGYDWLLAPDPGKCDRLEADIPFTDGDMGGWDECAPTIVRCTAPGGIPLPDHGSLWDQPWTEDADTVSIVDRCLDIHFSRSVRPIDGGIRLDYAARATRRAPVPIL